MTRCLGDSVAPVGDLAYKGSAPLYAASVRRKSGNKSDGGVNGLSIARLSVRVCLSAFASSFRASPRIIHQPVMMGASIYLCRSSSSSLTCANVELSVDLASRARTFHQSFRLVMRFSLLSL